MNLEGLLNAAAALEKRVATDQLLRKYLSTVWPKTDGASAATKPARADGVPPASGHVELTLSFPPEMCEMLQIAAKATGKTPGQLLEESFAEYCAKNIKNWNVGA